MVAFDVVGDGLRAAHSFTGWLGGIRSYRQDTRNKVEIKDARSCPTE